MKSIICRLLACIGAVLAALALVVAPAMAEGEYVEGEVLVVYEPATAAPEQEMDELGYAIVDEFSHPDGADAVVAEIPDAMRVEDAVAELEGMEGVALVQPNYLYWLETEQEQPQDLWVALASVNDIYVKDGSQFNVARHQIFDAWELVHTDHAVSVVVLDTGCRLDHYDLVENLDVANAWDFSNGRDQSLASSVAAGNVLNGGDEQGHGTHVSGIISARANNGRGVAGVSYDAKLIPMDVFDKVVNQSDQSTSWSSSTSTLLKALNKTLALHQADPAVRVVNMSVGAAGTDTLLAQAITQLWDEGVLCVCAAGNENITDAYIPADCGPALSVMSLDKDGNHTSYTNYKVGTDIEAGRTVSATGGAASTDGRILSTYCSTQDSYAYMHGTSQAAPLVSGVAALVWAANPSLGVGTVRGILVNTAVPVQSTNSNAHKDAASAGSVDAYAAVLAAKELLLTSVAEPTVVEGLVYTGQPQTGVVAGEGYTLSGNTATDAGTYIATATLTDPDQFMWADGTSAPKSLTWSIEAAPLTATYAGGTIGAGEAVPSTVDVVGFVGGESAQTAADYVAPTVDTSAVNNFWKNTYRLVPAGGSARNYTFSYEAGTLVVNGMQAVQAPTARTGLTYNGRSQVGVASAAGYTLSGTPEAADVGSYSATATLKGGYAWPDGTTAAKTFRWGIAAARLSATYAGATVALGATIPATVQVTGFVGGESARTATGYTAPTVSIPANASKVPGTYSIRPSGGSAKNYTFAYVAGTLSVYGTATAPSGKTFTYTGRAQTGVAVGAGYTLSGTASATNAGSYTATARLAANYRWKDGTTAPKSVSWRINAASLASAKLQGVGKQDYTGRALTPTPVVSWSGGALRAGTDYTLSYANNVNVGTATVTARGRGNFAGSISTTFAITSASVSYRTHVQNVGWQAWKKDGSMSGTSGRSLRLEGIEIALSSAPYAGGIRYRTHVQNIGWQGWKQNGAMSGTSGRSLRLEAIEIELTGEMAAHYDVYYRVHAQDVGWMGWAKNGGRAGTATYSRRLEGIQIVLVAKGGTAPGSSFAGIAQRVSYPYATRQLGCRTHVQNVGWQDWRYDGATSGTSGRSLRLEGICIKLSDQLYSGGIRYRTHVQNIGWQGWKQNGAMSGTSGRSLRLEAIEIELTGEMAAHYDVYYRVHAQSFGWMGWAKNGGRAGTAGYSYRLEAIQIRLVAKGGAAPGSTARPFRQR